jgi:hypothetical protein
MGMLQARQTMPPATGIARYVACKIRLCQLPSSDTLAFSHAVGTAVVPTHYSF